MKAGALMFGLLALVGARPAEAADTRVKRREFNPVAMLDAIAAVESDARPWRVGAKGERGRCQMLHTTWVRYTNADFARWASIDCDLTRRVERAHLHFLIRKYFASGTEINVRLLAAAWRWENGAGDHLRSDYAKRIENLYTEATK